MIAIAQTDKNVTGEISPNNPIRMIMATAIISQRYFIRFMQGRQ